MISIVYLEITSFRGMSIGATHYYGKLVCPNANSVELCYQLTKAEVDELNARDRTMCYREGELSIRFSTRSDIINLVLVDWKKHYPSAQLLVLGRASIVEPQQVLAGEQKLMDEINILAAQAEECNYWDDEEAMTQICDKWMTLVEFNCRRE